MTIPARRAIAAEIATRFQEMNLTKEQLMRLMVAMKEAANKGNIVELFQYLGEIEFRLNFIGEENTLMELAAIYFVMDGEDETTLDEKWKQIKLDSFKGDGDLKDFFLQRAFTLTTNYSNISGTGILDYLKANVPNEERLNRILRELKLDNTLIQ
ncbi:MAG: hypothetical protein ACKOPP_04215 [Bacteroidota bacterium]